MEGNSILGMIAVGLLYALLITLPILVIILVARAIKRMDSPHQKEMRRLLSQLVISLEENNRLLTQQNATRQPDEKH
jgi:Na+/serine symporter